MSVNRSRGVLIGFHGRKLLVGISTRRDQHSLNRLGTVADVARWLSMPRRSKQPQWQLMTAHRAAGASSND